jgi:hypothetical protein
LNEATAVPSKSDLPRLLCVIRIKLRSLLDQHLDKLRYEVGDNYGDPGWTWVYPKVRLPDQRERMATAILTYCIEGKTEEKILREFNKSGEPQVKQAVRSLAKQGKLKTVNKGSKVLYQTVHIANPDAPT